VENAISVMERTKSIILIFKVGRGVERRVSTAPIYNSEKNSSWIVYNSTIMATM
jgi:nicotinamide mononucleotide adenylyltransferase